ncbi:hypothetical protein EVAR_83375_1 [Eumeta japonica]|uniref:Uncharacterized protein n=1 Tax=Eumeta variegata TaxID=151549 RepID=A0A4C1TYB3_EUMVA|nr:hypothetical protein EVAR_83375_1 [Eumeta japonica]
MVLFSGNPRRARSTCNSTNRHVRIARHSPARRRTSSPPEIIIKSFTSERRDLCARLKGKAERPGGLPARFPGLLPPPTYRSFLRYFCVSQIYLLICGIGLYREADIQRRAREVIVRFSSFCKSIGTARAYTRAARAGRRRHDAAAVARAIEQLHEFTQRDVQG